MLEQRPDSEDLLGCLALDSLRRPRVGTVGVVVEDRLHGCEGHARDLGGALVPDPRLGEDGEVVTDGLCVDESSVDAVQAGAATLLLSDTGRGRAVLAPAPVLHVRDPGAVLVDPAVGAFAGDAGGAVARG